MKKYQGQRAKLRGYLGNAKILLQIDFGFGDAVTSDIVDEQLPTLLNDIPAPSLFTYPKVATIAEKFEAMVDLGIRNTRMKDFYDVWALSETLEFDGVELQEAVEATFDRRDTTWSPAMPEALRSTFYSDPDLQGRWQSYGQSGQLLKSPPSGFGEIGSRIQSFLGPVRESIIAGQSFEKHWVPGGPWRSLPIS